MSPAWLANLLSPLLEVNLAAGAGILLVLALRRPVLKAFGARAAYGLWLVPLLAGLAILAPARLAPAPVLPSSVVAAPGLPEAVMVLTQTAAPPPALIHFERDLAAWIWLAGALVCLAWLVMSHLRFLAAERAGRAGPAVAGLLRPRIVLPADFESRFEPAERAAILAHEQAHLRGQDSRINALASILGCFAWFNPLVYLAGRRLRLDQDLARDEAALAQRPGQARLYAATLLKAQMRGASSPAACAFGDHPLAERIALAARVRPGRTRRMAGMTLALGLALSGAVAAWAAQPARPAPAPQDRALSAGAPTPREGAPLEAASRTPAARQLLAKAVPSPEGETMITTSLAPRRLAAAAILAFGLGTGSSQAAAPPPVAPMPYVSTAKPVETDRDVLYTSAPTLPSPPNVPPRRDPPPPPPPPPAAPPPPARPTPIPREVPPPPAVSYSYAPATAYSAATAGAPSTLVLIDGSRITCSAGPDQCAQLAALSKAKAQLEAQADALKARIQAQALSTDPQGQVQALKAQVDALAQARAEVLKTQADIAGSGQ